MQIMKREHAIKRFQLSDADTCMPLVVIEATNEEEAVQRCKLIADEIQLQDYEIFAVAEHPIGAPVTTAFYADTHFLLMEAANQTLH